MRSAGDQVGGVQRRLPWRFAGQPPARASELGAIVIPVAEDALEILDRSPGTEVRHRNAAPHRRRRCTRPAPVGRCHDTASSNKRRCLIPPSMFCAGSNVADLVHLAPSTASAASARRAPFGERAYGTKSDSARITALTSAGSTPSRPATSEMMRLSKAACGAAGRALVATKRPLLRDASYPRLVAR